MKRFTVFVLSLVLLFLAVGCGNAEGELPPEPTPDPVVDNEQPSDESTSTPAALTVSDFMAVLDALDLSEAVLTYHQNGKEESYPAGAAIQFERYIEELKAFQWETYTPSAGWDGHEGCFYQLTASGMTITVLQSGYTDSRPLHLVTDSAEGWFVLPYIHNATENELVQVSWMVYDVFEHWYREARGATLYPGEGKPLTEEELAFFVEYTETFWDEGITPISCFFTSYYTDPRDMNAAEFIYYCPLEYTLTWDDEAEFQLVMEQSDWWAGEGMTLEEMPVPCHRYTRSYLNEILMRYAGITLEEMHTDWLEELLYVPETDCFYTFTSDCGPGVFIPVYGRQNGDIVTLWGYGNGNIDAVLTLQKSGDNWHILSHTVAEKK